MFVATQPFLFCDHLFEKNSEVPEKYVSKRMIELGMVSLKEEKPEPKPEKVKKKKEEKILTENSSKVEIIKE